MVDCTWAHKYGGFLKCEGCLESEDFTGNMGVTSRL